MIRIALETIEVATNLLVYMKMDVSALKQDQNENSQGENNYTTLISCIQSAREEVEREDVR